MKFSTALKKCLKSCSDDVFTNTKTRNKTVFFYLMELYKGEYLYSCQIQAKEAGVGLQAG